MAWVRALFALMVSVTLIVGGLVPAAQASCPAECCDCGSGCSCIATADEPFESPPAVPAAAFHGIELQPALLAPAWPLSAPAAGYTPPAISFSSPSPCPIAPLFERDCAWLI